MITKGVQNNDSAHLTNIVLSLQDAGMAFQIVAAAVPEVTCDLPVTAASSVKELPHLRGLQLADPQFHNPGKVNLRTSWPNLFLLVTTRLDQKALPLLSRQSLVGPLGV